MFNRIQGIIDYIQDSKVVEVLDSVRRKQRLLKSEIEINENTIEFNLNSHLIMNADRLFISDIKTDYANEYYQVTFSNGEFIHYDLFGKAYLSLNPNSKLYKLRLSRYDIKQII